MTNDIWHDDEGIWLQVGPHTYGPFRSEQEAEQFQLELAEAV